MLSASSGEFLRFFLFYWSPASSLVTAVSTAFPSSEARSHFRNSRRVMVEVIRSPLMVIGVVEQKGHRGGLELPTARYLTLDSSFPHRQLRQFHCL